MREVRTIDNNQGVGVRGDDRFRRFADMPEDFWQLLRDRGQTDDGEVIDGKRARDSGSCHGPAAYAGKLKRAAGMLFERAGERSTEGVAGFLTGDDINRQGSRRLRHRTGSSRTPTRKIPA